QPGRAAPGRFSTRGDRMGDVPLPQAADPGRPAHRRRLRAKLMRVIRRGHLFAGLFMLPWVVLYGVTAFLFNHPDAFPDHQTRPFGAAELAGTSLEGLPSPAGAAAQVVVALRAEAIGRDGGTAALRLVHPEQAT